MSEAEIDKRPWGEFRVLAAGAGFQVKRIDVHAGARISYQRHQRRAEHWTIVAGRARVTLDGSEIELEPGQSIDIPVRGMHRVESLGPADLVFIEVQRGEYLGEDDIERFSDDYGRA